MVRRRFCELEPDFVQCFLLCGDGPLILTFCFDTFCFARTSNEPAYMELQNSVYNRWPRLGIQALKVKPRDLSPDVVECF